jgi:hypothetical protein
MLRLALKDGVVLTARHFDADFVPVFRCILEKWTTTADLRVWITAAFEERDGFHGVHRAIDVRTHNIMRWGDHPHTRRTRLVELAEKCKARLGKHWDVVAHEELAGKPEEHIHFERDDKGE